MGLTLSSLLQINYSNLELKGNLKFHTFTSIDGRDRYYKDILPQNNFHLTDRRFIYDLSLGYRVPNTALQLAVGLEKIDRWGTVENFSRQSAERRSYVQIRYLF
jgi:hypothetical protein